MYMYIYIYIQTRTHTVVHTDLVLPAQQTYYKKNTCINKTNKIKSSSSCNYLLNHSTSCVYM